jgi:pyruvate dehydrogenase E1 component beta subunit|tara:strand:+ start:755 stop:1795 length:1041 start_codon:yes stop_codon:yes gene_type:complete
MRTLSYRDAINEALVQEMRRDDTVFVYGIDVADHKSIFGTTKGILKEFGSERCFNTPLAEDAMTGVGLGAAINGLRPVHVHMRVDFLMLAMNQLANMVSSYHYGSNGKISVPMVIRAIIGRGWGQAWQHSKSLQSVFAHLPGLIVVMPATPEEAKGMTISAIRNENPVLILEHRWLYDAEGDVPEESYKTSLYDAKILRRGKDITIVATSWMNVEAMYAANILAKHDISAEVINARNISHSHDALIIDSVNKTRQCVIADNDWLYCGFSAELASFIYHECFGELLSPISRIGFAEVPCPCTRSLENEFYPNAANLVNEITDKLQVDTIDLSDENFYSYENKFRGPF